MGIIISYEDYRRLETTRRSFKVRNVVKPSYKIERDFHDKLSEVWGIIGENLKAQVIGMIEDGTPHIEIINFIDNQNKITDNLSRFYLDGIVQKWSKELSFEHKMKLSNILSRAFRIDIKGIVDDPSIKHAIELGVRESVKLIRNIPIHVGIEIEKTLFDHAKGHRFPAGRNLIEQIQFIADMPFKRAKLIARDQISKFIGILNRVRQMSIGISEYIWHNAGDIHVVGNPNGVYPTGTQAHMDHWTLEGKICRWDDPTVYKNQDGKWVKRTSTMTKTAPGEDIQCRCFPEPVIDMKQILEKAEVL